jgi:hypothetical protein
VIRVSTQAISPSRTMVGAPPPNKLGGRLRQRGQPEYGGAASSVTSPGATAIWRLGREKLWWHLQCLGRMVLSQAPTLKADQDSADVVVLAAILARLTYQDLCGDM